MLIFHMLILQTQSLPKNGQKRFEIVYKTNKQAKITMNITN